MVPSVRDYPRVSRRGLLAGVGAGVSGLSTWGLAPLFRSEGLPRDPPRIVGHRGAEGLAPPNTIAAIRAALDSGVDGVELDVWETADGELLLFHDAVLDWDSTASGWVANTPWSEIEGETVGGEPLITLPEALAELQGTGVDLYLELKGESYADAVLETVDEYGFRDRLTVISFTPEHLDPVQEAGDRTGLVGSAPTPWLAEDAADCGADVAMSHYAPRATETFLEEARDRGLTAGIWKLVETEDTLRDAIEVGPDVVVTNHPERAVEIVDDR